MKFCNETDQMIQETLDALIELSRHEAFGDDAPEFNEGGVGHEACRKLREYLESRYYRGLPREAGLRDR